MSRHKEDICGAAALKAQNLLKLYFRIDHVTLEKEGGDLTSSFSCLNLVQCTGILPNNQLNICVNWQNVEIAEFYQSFVENERVFWEFACTFTCSSA